MSWLNLRTDYTTATLTHSEKPDLLTEEPVY